MYIHTTIQWKLFLFALFTLFCIVLKSFYLSHHKKECLDYIPVSAAATFLILFVLTWFVFLYSIMPWHTQIAVIFLVVLIPYLFYLSVKSDPGFIHSTGANRVQMTKEIIEQNQFGNNFCITCLIKRPPRSKHCRMECAEMETLSTIMCEPMVLISAFFASIISFMTGCLFFLQLYQISIGLTTNERLNSRKYGFMAMKEGKYSTVSPYE
ncbi:hypothetical protein M3Y94_00303400 [Aphelenchoides besseyi]|nr:hypothetical protein M3Y94_00303400 [Aphelenchoides besseyi]